VKQNVWGNDRGDTAFAVMPRIKIPTGTELSNGRAEGSVIGTFGWELADGWDIGLQAEPGFAYEESDDSYLAELGHTAVLGFPLIDPWAGYVEYGGLLTSESLDAYEAVFSTGLTYEINPDAVLDVGTRIGLTDEAEDATVFTGITMRF
jgi:hypothetical protein